MLVGGCYAEVQSLWASLPALPITGWLKHRTQKIKGVPMRLRLDLFSLPFLSPYQVQTAKQSIENGGWGRAFPASQFPASRSSQHLRSYCFLDGVKTITHPPTPA